jgi:hypothetical protein
LLLVAVIIALWISGIQLTIRENLVSPSLVKIARQQEKKSPNENSTLMHCGKRLPGLQAKASTWQPAGNGSDTFVFSAYLDFRENQTYIRLNGISSVYNRKPPPPEYCLLWYEHSGASGGTATLESTIVQAEAHFHPDHHSRT